MLFHPPSYLVLLANDILYDYLCAMVCCQDTEGMHKCRKCWRKYVGFAPGRMAGCNHGDSRHSHNPNCTPQVRLPQDTSSAPKRACGVASQPQEKSGADNSRLILIFMCIYIYNYINIASVEVYRPMITTLLKDFLWMGHSVCLSDSAHPPH